MVKMKAMKEKETVVPINEDVIREIVKRVLIKSAKDDIEQKKQPIN